MYSTIFPAKADQSLQVFEKYGREMVKIKTVHTNSSAYGNKNFTSLTGGLFKVYFTYSQCFPRASLGDSNHISATHGNWPALGLNSCWLFKTLSPAK
jgi:hypothetical protein